MDGHLFWVESCSTPQGVAQSDSACRASGATASLDGVSTHEANGKIMGREEETSLSGRTKKQGSFFQFLCSTASRFFLPTWRCHDAARRRLKAGRAEAATRSALAGHALTASAAASHCAWSDQ